MAIVTCPNCGAKNRIEDRPGLQPVCGKCGTKLSASQSSTPIELTDATFDQIIHSAGPRPILVDCWAPWCGPCRMIAPMMDELARESDSRYLVAKLNTDQNPQTAQRYQISGIPTLLLFKNGQLADRLVGAYPKEAMQSRLERLL
jgi:thioredoxin 2